MFSADVTYDPFKGGPELVRMAGIVFGIAEYPLTEVWLNCQQPSFCRKP